MGLTYPKRRIAFMKTGVRRVGTPYPKPRILLGVTGGVAFLKTGARRLGTPYPKPRS